MAPIDFSRRRSRFGHEVGWQVFGSLTLFGLAQGDKACARLAVDGLGLIDTGEGLGQFGGQFFTGPLGGIQIFGLAEMFGEAVADDLDLFQFAFDFEFLALEQDEAAGEFLDDFAAALDRIRAACG